MADTSAHTKPLSVSAAMAVAKSALESCTITLVGEVSEVSNKPGYKAVYFSVKDEGATLPAMMWMNRFKAAGIELRLGMLVQLTGRFTLYAQKGRMNFDVFSLSIAGEGDLRAKVANLARKLKDEGLMDPNRKRAIPSYPETIGLVTSPRGAAVHDVMRTMRRRFPLTRILLAGVPVEGVEAPRYLCEGIRCVENAGAELILLVRGGGSFEDLMPFNDEHLARTIAACSVPVVTGIGHEPDTSIADMVADLRASTPTAAAESVVPDVFELSTALADKQIHMQNSFAARLHLSSEALKSRASRPALADPTLLYSQEGQALDHYSDRIGRALPATIARSANELAFLTSNLSAKGKALTQHHALHCNENALQLRLLGSRLFDSFVAEITGRAARLDDLSPLAVLSRGFSLARTKKGSLIKSINHVHKGDEISITVADGNINCSVQETNYSNNEILSWKEYS